MPLRAVRHRITTRGLCSPRLTTTAANFEKAVISFAFPCNLISRIQSHVVVKILKGLSTRRLAGTKQTDGDREERGGGGDGRLPR